MQSLSLRSKADYINEQSTSMSVFPEGRGIRECSIDLKTAATVQLQTTVTVSEYKAGLIRSDVSRKIENPDFI